MTTAETITYEQIEAVKDAATRSGNAQLAALCDVAMDDGFYGRRDQPQRMYTQARHRVADAYSAMVGGAARTRTRTAPLRGPERLDVDNAAEQLAKALGDLAAARARIVVLEHELEHERDLVAALRGWPEVEYTPDTMVVDVDQAGGS